MEIYIVGNTGKTLRKINLKTKRGLQMQYLVLFCTSFQSPCLLERNNNSAFFMKLL